ncbi:MAG: DUF4831 family protein [Bacteroidales bacterium]|nr:DUF4831 family protein [Bacteroidales bacterium]MCF8403803.1 DUF4831 family protein [Bacteroidales bacterium]
MIRKKYFILFLIIGLVSQFGLSQINVKPLTSSGNFSDKNGFIYSLPYNYIKVKMEVTKTEFIAGPYAEYASKYLDLQNVVESDYNEYRISSAQLDQITSSDPDNIFFVEFTDKLSKEEKTLFVQLGKTGLISNFNRDLGTNPDLTHKIDNQKEINKKELFNYFAETNLYESFDTIIKKVVVDTVSVESIFLDRKWVEKSDEQKAVEAANKISKIREARYNLLTGYQEISYESGTIRYMDEQLMRMEKEYLSLFMGISIQKKLVYTIVVDPGKTNESNQLAVCIFSETGGIRELNAAGGERIYLKLDVLDNQASVQSTFDNRNSSNTDKGFYYRIPSLVKFDLAITKDLQISAIYPISQYGITTYLPPNVTEVQFNENTGALKSIKYK